VLAFPASGNGDIAPLASGTGPGSPHYVAFDKKGNIYVSNGCSNDVTIFAKGSSGDATPIATIGGAATGLSTPEGIAVDPKGGNIYVANAGGNVTIYPALGSSTEMLNEAPIAIISGSNTDLLKPIGIALDASLNIYVAQKCGE
jgi:DNA-binding beta-propeller fold protein YncE